MGKCNHSSAGTWHGMGEERRKYDFFFPKNRNGDNFILDGKFEWVESTTWVNKISLEISVKDEITPLNDISKIQFALNLVNHYEIKDIEKAMLKYIKEELPEKMI